MGIYRNGILLLIPILVAVAQCRECYSLISMMNREGMLTSSVTILDYYMYCVRGMSIFYFDPTSYFLIPIYWFTLQIFISYFTGYYSHNDFTQNGRNLFLAIKDRKSWWDSKCLWCISSVLLNYAVLAVAAVISGTLCGAEWRLSNTMGFMTGIFGVDMSYLTSGQAVFVSFALPCLITIGLCLLQIFVGFLTTPVVSFACMCGVYVLSAYYTKWFMLGNYTMWMRSTYFTEDGVNPVSGLLIGVMLSVCVWYAGRLYFAEKDIL